MPRRIPRLTDAALAAASFAFAFGAAELFLAVAGIDWTASLMTNDRTLGWALRPNARGWFLDEGGARVEVSAQGTRDRERTLEKPAGTVRLAVVGDSTTESRQVELEESWPYLLEQRLAACAGGSARAVEVLNFGVGGYGTAQELLMLETRALGFDPDVVLLAFYPGNDLFNNVRALNPTNPEHAPYFHLDDAGELFLDTSFTAQPELDPGYITRRNLAGEVMNRSRLLRGLFHAYTELGTRQQRREKDLRGIGLTLDAQAVSFFYPPEHAGSPPGLGEAWRITEALITRFQSLVHERGRAPVLTTMTVAAQVHPDPEARAALADTLGLPGLDYPNRRVERLASSLGLLHVDQLAPVAERATADGVALHGFRERGRLNDGHLNPAGHQVVAELLARALCEHPTIRGDAVFW